jgi:2,3-diketo-5-methylthio-1-phosphopentane phosphatase
VSRPRLKCHVFIDFDGTIVPRDASDFLFERFADPAWQDIEQDWKSGRIGSRECMARQVALLRATPEVLRAAIATLAIDRGFAGFVRNCHVWGVGMTVISDGFDLVIEQVLRSAGLMLPYFANRLSSLGSDRWRVTFPFARSDCRALAGNCKCSFTEPHAAAVKVVIGDGRSDYCLSQRADLVFAKAELLELCRSSGAPHFAFADFCDVSTTLAAWLGRDTQPDAGNSSAHGAAHAGGERAKGAVQGAGERAPQCTPERAGRPPG